MPIRYLAVGVRSTRVPKRWKRQSCSYRKRYLSVCQTWYGVSVFAARRSYQCRVVHVEGRVAGLFAGECLVYAWVLRSRPCSFGSGGLSFWLAGYLRCVFPVSLGEF